VHAHRTTADFHYFVSKFKIRKALVVLTALNEQKSKQKGNRKIIQVMSGIMKAILQCH
jgi:hypothetical protein